MNELVELADDRLLRFRIESAAEQVVELVLEILERMRDRAVILAEQRIGSLAYLSKGVLKFLVEVRLHLMKRCLDHVSVLRDLCELDRARADLARVVHGGLGVVGLPREVQDLRVRLMEVVENDLVIADRNAQPHTHHRVVVRSGVGHG